MTPVPMTLTEGQGQIFPKMCKNQRTGHISNSIEPTNFVLGFNTQQHDVHLMIKIKVNLTDDEGHMRRSKVIKMN